MRAVREALLRYSPLHGKNNHGNKRQQRSDPVLSPQRENNQQDKDDGGNQLRSIRDFFPGKESAPAQIPREEPQRAPASRTTLGRAAAAHAQKHITKLKFDMEAVMNQRKKNLENLATHEQKAAAQRAAQEVEAKEAKRKDGIKAGSVEDTNTEEEEQEGEPAAPITTEAGKEDPDSAPGDADATKEDNPVEGKEENENDKSDVQESTNQGAEDRKD